MAVTDEEFAKQLWELDWSLINEINEDSVLWEVADEAVRESYRNQVKFIRESDWFQAEMDQSYWEGRDD
jgi:hypothetical protein